MRIPTGAETKRRWVPIPARPRYRYIATGRLAGIGDRGNGSCKRIVMTNAMLAGTQVPCLRGHGDTNAMLARTTGEAKSRGQGMAPETKLYRGLNKPYYNGSTMLKAGYKGLMHINIYYI